MRKLKKRIKQEAEQVSEASIRVFDKLWNLLINVRLPKFRNPQILLKAALIFLLVFVNISGAPSHTEANGGVSAKPTQLSPHIVYVNVVKDKFESKLVTEVEAYINKMAPTSGLEASYLVEKCLEYETDIIFVLAQGLLESHFGTKGVAVKTNSVWNVGAYDNQRPRNWYETPNESLEPYLKLLREDYLMNITHAGDTIQKEVQELVMEDRRYINYNGYRFASARGYENGMRKLMVRIDMETSINFYQDILSLSNEEFLAYFAPPEQLELNGEEFTAMNF